MLFRPEKRTAARLKYDTNADFFMADSAIECYPTHLQVDDFYVRVLTLKEPTGQSWPLILKQLYEIEASFHVVTEWHPRDNAAARKKIQSARRHFHNSKTSLMSQIKADGSPRAADVLVDDSKEKILDFVVGDKDFWVVEGVQNFCYVKPAKQGSNTNLTLITAAGNVYSLLLTEIGDA